MTRMKLLVTFAICILSVFALSPQGYCQNPSTVVYVAADGSDSNNGSSWQYPMQTIQAAADYITNNSLQLPGEIRVKGYSNGTVYYGPVYIQSDISIKGGYTGNLSVPEERDLGENPTCITVLDGGDVDCNGLVVLYGVAATTTIDRIQFQHYTDGAITLSDLSVGMPTISNCNICSNSGGGIRCTDASPTIYNCKIFSNTADQGAGIFADVYSFPDIEYCSIYSNYAASSFSCGIGIYLYQGICSYNTITGNTGTRGYGAGIYYGPYGDVPTGSIYSNAQSICAYNTMENNAFSSSTGSGGGGIYTSDSGMISFTGNRMIGNSAGTGGGMFFSSLSGSTTVKSNLIESNVAGLSTGGVYFSSAEFGCNFRNNTVVNNSGGSSVSCALYLNTGPSSAYIANNIISAGSSSYGIYVRNSPYYELRNNCLFNNSTNYNIAPYAQSGNIFSDPGFGLDGYHLASGSPCIDTGIGSAASDEDIDEEPRQTPSGGAVDIGADEYKPLTVAITPATTITNTSPVVFNVIFSDPTTDFDDPSDVEISGTAGLNNGNTNITISPVANTNDTQYQVSVPITGTTAGTVIAAISTGVAQNKVSGVPNSASAYSNEVEFDNIAPSNPSDLYLDRIIVTSNKIHARWTLPVDTGSAVRYKYKVVWKNTNGTLYETSWSYTDKTDIVIPLAAVPQEAWQYCLHIIAEDAASNCSAEVISAWVTAEKVKVRLLNYRCASANSRVEVNDFIYHLWRQGNQNNIYDNYVNRMWYQELSGPPSDEHAYDDIDVLFILAPDTYFTDTELKAIKSFVNKGFQRRLVLIGNPNNSTSGTITANPENVNLNLLADELDMNVHFDTFFYIIDGLGSPASQRSDQTLNQYHYLADGVYSISYQGTGAPLWDANFPPYPPGKMYQPDDTDDKWIGRTQGLMFNRHVPWLAEDDLPNGGCSRIVIHDVDLFLHAYDSAFWHSTADDDANCRFVGNLCTLFR